MDNRQINIRAEEKADFILSMKLAVDARKTVGYTVTKEGALVLFWSECKGETFFNKLPYEMTVEQITEFAWGWLCSVNPNEPEPDHDGSNGRAFKKKVIKGGDLIRLVNMKIGFTIIVNADFNRVRRVGC